uniref:Uncharacterized protein n=1 Tax=Hordeum vulgare subsp. vulgare TaxID=112509 RepID=A0A8I6X1C3_HORVV
MMGRVACTCDCGGDISASQEDALAASSFLGGDDQDEESEAFPTPLDLSSQQQQQEEEDTVTMCTLPSTPSPTRSPSPPPASPLPRRKPRVCVRKVKARGAKIRTPTPDQPPEPGQPPEPEHADPLYRAVLMVGATASSSNGNNAIDDFLALARRRGLL